MRIKSDNTMCLVIDIQERLAPSINNIDLVEKNSITLLKGLEVLDINTIVTRQYPKGLGDTTEAIKDVTKNSKVFDKTEFSCYGNYEIKKEIDSCNKKNIILIGIETHICVLQTLIDLKGAGFNPIIVEDCVASRKANDKFIGIKRGEFEGGIITTYESILFELLEKAGSNIFKKISALIK